MSDELILYSVEDGIATLTLNNPKKRNALSMEMMASLKSRLDSIRHDKEVRVVIIKAEGHVFSSGHDLSELRGGAEEQYRAIFAACTEMMEAIRTLPKPVIAQVDGLATAAGCQLVATCDLAVCSENSKFATPGVNIGLFCTTPGVAVARSVTRKKAMEMLLTGAPLSAEAAEDAGLVNRVVPADKLEANTRELAATIAKASAYTVSIGKQAFYKQVELDVPEAYKFAEKVMVENTLAEDAVEGIGAFFEKREPQWRH